jgi:hypothetical protein
MRPEPHVVQSGEVSEEVKVLENKADLGADAMDVHPGRRDLHIFQPNLPSVRFGEAVDAPKERGFSCTGRADDDLRFALF